MISIRSCFYLFTFFILCYFCCISEGRDIPYGGIRSDVIVTKYNVEKSNVDDEEITTEPGWVRRTLLKFGKVASSAGNALGRHSVKVTSAIEKICEIIKTIVPVISAICGVGQFQFCSATNGVSDDLNSALKPNPNDLNIPD